MLADNSRICNSVGAIGSYRNEIVAHFIPHIDTSVIPQCTPKYKGKDSNTVWGNEYRTNKKKNEAKLGEGKSRRY